MSVWSRVVWIVHWRTVLVQWANDAHVWVHVVGDVLLILLALILELSCHLLAENLHVLLDTLLDLLLNKNSDSLAHVDRYLLKLGIVLAIENVGLERLTGFAVYHLRLLRLQLTHLRFFQIF